MLIQKAGEENGTLPPPGYVPPSWSILAKSTEWSQDIVAETNTIGPHTISYGHNDVEELDEVQGSTTRDVNEYGWDNESPQRYLNVKKCRIETTPVLNGQFYEFWVKEGKKAALPALWSLSGSGEVEVWC
jgi:L-histidine Nalpha-methyltransferase / hercynylcysteine S-oxide synthase